MHLPSRRSTVLDHMNLFGSDLFSDMIICGSVFNIQQFLVFLVTGFINFGVTNQAPQISLNFVVEDSMLFLSYEVADVRIPYAKLYYQHLISIS